MRIVSAIEVEEEFTTKGSQNGVSASVAEMIEEMEKITPGEAQWFLCEGKELQRTLSQRAGNGVRYTGAFNRYFKKIGSAKANGRTAKGIKILRVTDADAERYATDGAPDGWERFAPKDESES